MLEGLQLRLSRCSYESGAVLENKQIDLTTSEEAQLTSLANPRRTRAPEPQVREPKPELSTLANPRRIRLGGVER